MVGALAERKVPGKAITMAKNKVFIYYLEEYFQKTGRNDFTAEHSFCSFRRCSLPHAEVLEYRAEHLVCCDFATGDFGQMVDALAEVLCH